MPEMLQTHFRFLYYVLEPREFADEMFERDHLSTTDHDFITYSSQKFERLKNLLQTVEESKLYFPFLCAFESLNYDEVLETLCSDGSWTLNLSKFNSRFKTSTI